MNRAKTVLSLLSCLMPASSQTAPQSSLVGAWTIATDQELNRDTITLWFRHENGTVYPTTLSYSLEPSGMLTVERGRDHAVCCFGGIDKHLTDERWRKQLSGDMQINIRRMLARLRPLTLSKDVPFVLPKGCGYVFDSRPWNGVWYSQGKLGGTFMFQPNCDGAGADEVRSLLRSVIGELPQVEGSYEFLKAK